MSDRMNLKDRDLVREKWYREHYREVYAAGCYPYEDYQDAYRYGYSMGQAWDEPEFDWMLVRTEARRGWEALYDRPWPEVEDAVREGWRRALARA